MYLCIKHYMSEIFAMVISLFHFAAFLASSPLIISIAACINLVSLEALFIEHPSINIVHPPSTYYKISGVQVPHRLSFVRKKLTIKMSAFNIDWVSSQPPHTSVGCG